MNTLSTTSGRLVILLLCVLPHIVARSQEKSGTTSFVTSTVEGTVLDTANLPVAGATVSLEKEDQEKKFATQSDCHGNFRFESVPSGNYRLRARKADSGEVGLAPFAVHEGKTNKFILHLEKTDASATAADTFSSVPFSDEPQFTVAGVTDPSNLGGHGSDTALLTKESLAKDAAVLSRSKASTPENSPSAAEASAEIHANLGDAAEREGRPLEAVREYQRAAELNPSESHLFSWGAELLLHRAFKPAIEVFEKGNRLYPKSARLLVGLGVAAYDQGATDRGQRLLLQACDLDPADATPYLFLGKLQAAEKITPPGWKEKLERFTERHPENALAHYYYAVALGKQSGSQAVENGAMREGELKKSIELDPNFGDAYLQLGILYSARKNNPAAMSAFREAIQLSALPDEAHYRLAQLYRQEGESEKARAEMALYIKTSRQKTELAQEQRHELQQFVYTLHGQQPPSPAPLANPH